MGEDMTYQPTDQSQQLARPTSLEGWSFCTHHTSPDIFMPSSSQQRAQSIQAIVQHTHHQGNAETGSGAFSTERRPPADQVQKGVFSTSESWDGNGESARSGGAASKATSEGTDQSTVPLSFGKVLSSLVQNKCYTFNIKKGFLHTSLKETDVHSHHLCVPQ